MYFPHLGFRSCLNLFSLHSGNTLSGITGYGVLIDQSYPSTLGTPGTGVIIQGITFSGTNKITVASSAKRLEINCGSTTSCPGYTSCSTRAFSQLLAYSLSIRTWNLAGLTITGGAAGAIKNAKASPRLYANIMISGTDHRLRRRLLVGPTDRVIDRTGASLFYTLWFMNLFAAAPFRVIKTLKHYKQTKSYGS